MRTQKTTTIQGNLRTVSPKTVKTTYLESWLKIESHHKIF